MLTRSVYDEGGKNKEAQLIRLFTRGRFEHAAICTSPPTFAEAAGGEGGAVFNLSLGRCFTHDLNNVRVLRWPDATAALKAAQFCQLQVGRPYSRIRAIATKLPLKIPETDRGVFCSSLVALAYKDADPAAFRNLRPDKISPAGIGRLRGFKNITRQVFYPGPSPRNAEDLVALDGKQTGSPAYEQTMITLDYAKALLPLSDALVEAFPEAELERPETFYGVLHMLTSAHDARPKIAPVRRNDYLNALRAIDEEALRVMSDQRLQKNMETFVRLERRALTRAITESEQSNPDVDAQQLAGLLVARRNSLDRRRQGAVSFIPYEAAFGSLRAYVELQTSVNDEFERGITEIQHILERLQSN